MTDAPAIASPFDAEIFEDVEDHAPTRWSSLAADLRFFAVCYFAGLLFFLVMLS